MISLLRSSTPDCCWLAYHHGAARLSRPDRGQLLSGKSLHFSRGFLKPDEFNFRTFIAGCRWLSLSIDGASLVTLFSGGCSTFQPVSESGSDAKVARKSGSEAQGRDRILRCRRWALNVLEVGPSASTKNLNRRPVVVLTDGEDNVRIKLDPHRSELLPKNVGRAADF